MALFPANGQTVIQSRCYHGTFKHQGMIRNATCTLLPNSRKGLRWSFASMGMVDPERMAKSN